MNEQGGHEEKKSELVVKERVMDEQGGARGEEFRDDRQGADHRRAGGGGARGEEIPDDRKEGLEEESHKEAFEEE